MGGGSETEGVRIKALSVLLSALMTVSCTSFRPVALDDLRSSLKEGDRIRVVTKDGKESTLRIVAFTNDSIFGKDQVIEFRDIQSVKKSRPDSLKTAGVAVLGFLAFVGLIILLASTANTSGPPP